MITLSTITKRSSKFITAITIKKIIITSINITLAIIIRGITTTLNYLMPIPA